MKIFAAVAVTVNAVAKNKICPSQYTGTDGSGCYEQTEIWTTGSTATSLQCNFKNDACLPVTCKYNGIEASFRSDLFDEGLEYFSLINSGDKEVLAVVNGVKKNLNASCPVNVVGNFLKLNWNYVTCKDFISVSMNGEKIRYSVTLESPGSKAGDKIEFYVDHSAQAVCDYESKVEIDGDGFWVNQEDVEAHKSANGTLADEFDCEFFSDPARTESTKIKSNNIVNMGDTLYGHVKSSPLAGLSYKLTDVIVSQGSQSFSVINNGVPDFVTVGATSGDQSATGKNIDFSWMSFGFSSNPGKEQNKLTIECKVGLELSTKSALSCEWSNQEKTVQAEGYPRPGFPESIGNQLGHLQCPAGQTIKVKSALYGRWSTQVCTGFKPSVSNKECSGYKDHTSFAAAKCDGLDYCTFHGHNKHNGDPCKGTSKYTVIEYECV